MVGTALSSGRFYDDFERYKNQEWFRRRKLRIEQVRKQSKEIAKALRQKVENEEKLRTEVFERIEEAKFKCWKAEKLDEMERKLRCALEQFGLGHKLAVAEPFHEEFVELKNNINMQKAQERGEIAIQEKYKSKKAERDAKMSQINRKKMTRKVEDLRSTLLRSVTGHRHWIENKEHQNFSACEPVFSDPRMISNLERKKLQVPYPQALTVTDKCVKKIIKADPKLKQINFCEGKFTYLDSIVQKNPSLVLPKKTDTTWINLNDVHNSSRTSITRSQCVKTNCNEPVKDYKAIEFYDFHSRYHCKTQRGYKNLVEKIDAAEVGVNTLKYNEEDTQTCDVEKKQKAIIVCKERGIEALRKEKIKQDYNNLITKLEDLNKKEKLIRAQQQTQSALIYMNDNRLSEHAKLKQKIMNSKFESIYYNATSELPPKRRTGSQCNVEKLINNNEEMNLKLSFSPSNFKVNSPVTSINVSLEHPPITKVYARRIEKTKKKKNLLLDVDKALMEGRKLRSTVMQSWDETTVIQGKIIKSDLETETTNEINTCQAEVKDDNDKFKNIKGLHSQESQTLDYIQENYGKEEKIELNVAHTNLGVQANHDTLTLSSSTSYKSPPSELSCRELRSLIKHLGYLSGTEGYNLMSNNPKFRRKLKEILSDLLNNSPTSETRECGVKYETNLNETLRYYISKLLNMSREKIANLSISSDTISDRDGTDCHHHLQSQNKSINSKKEQPVCEFRLNQNIDFQKSFENWKSPLEMIPREVETKILPDDFMAQAKETNMSLSTDGKTSFFKNEPNNFDMNETDELSDTSPQNSTTYKKLDAISEKCSMRISELTNLLNKVRRDKEVLINSESSLSSLASSASLFSPRAAEKYCDNQEDLTLFDDNCEADVAITSYGQEVTKCLYSSSEGSPSLAVNTRAGSDVDESVTTTGTFPDVMNELLNRNIISSPFKWDGKGDCSSLKQVKIPTIDTVIRDFRKKMSMIKPLSVSSSDAPLTCFKMNQVEWKNENFGEINDIQNCHSNKIKVPHNKESTYSNCNESSTENLDDTLANLGLNWAKGLLRKIEKSKTINSSSCSEEKKTRTMPTDMVVD